MPGTRTPIRRRNVPLTHPMRRRMRMTASFLRTLVHDAQYSNSNEDYETALRCARDMVDQLERAVVRTSN